MNDCLSWIFFSLAIYTLGNEFFLSEKTSCEKDL